MWRYVQARTHFSICCLLWEMEECRADALDITVLLIETQVAVWNLSLFYSETVSKHCNVC